MAAPLLLAIAGAGTAISAYSIWKQGRQQAQSLLESAAIQEAKANEVLRRNDINNDLIFSQGKQLIGSQIAAVAASGGGIANSMELFEETAAMVARDIRRSSEEAEWEARMALMESVSMRTSARQVKQASTISAFGTLLSGAAKTWDAAPRGYESTRVAKSSYGSDAPSILGDYWNKRTP